MDRLQVAKRDLKSRHLDKVWAAAHTANWYLGVAWHPGVMTQDHADSIEGFIPLANGLAASCGLRFVGFKGDLVEICQVAAQGAMRPMALAS